MNEIKTELAAIPDYIGQSLGEFELLLRTQKVLQFSSLTN